MDSNEARAYAAVALENCGVSPLTVGRVLNEMKNLCDRYTEREIMDKARHSVTRVNSPVLRFK